MDQHTHLNAFGLICGAVAVSPARIAWFGETVARVPAALVGGPEESHKAYLAIALREVLYSHFSPGGRCCTGN